MTRHGRRDRSAEGAEKRDAEGVERGGEWGGGLPLPSRLGGLGERRKLPQRDLGRSPGRKRFILLFRRDIRPLVAIFVCNSFPSPPPFSTPLRGLNPLFAVSTVLYFKIRVRSGLVSFWARIFLDFVTSIDKY